MPRDIPIIEIFGRTIAGEGNIAGQTSHFVRTGYCDFRCAWCDSMHAVDPTLVAQGARWMTPDQVVRDVVALGPARWVSLSGGNPAMHARLGEVVDGLQAAGYGVNVETQGSLWQDWLARCDVVTVSPKPPSAGMQGRERPETLERILALPQTCLKVVAFDEHDLDWIERRWGGRPNLYISTGTRLDDDPASLGERYRAICESVLRRPSLSAATVLLQLHVVAWGHRQGV